MIYYEKRKSLHVTEDLESSEAPRATHKKCLKTDSCLEAENFPPSCHRSPWEGGPDGEASFAAGKFVPHILVTSRVVEKPAAGAGCEHKGRSWPGQRQAAWLRGQGTFNGRTGVLLPKNDKEN